MTIKPVNIMGCVWHSTENEGEARQLHATSKCTLKLTQWCKGATLSVIWEVANWRITTTARHDKQREALPASPLSMCLTSLNVAAEQV